MDVNEIVRICFIFDLSEIERKKRMEKMSVIVTEQHKIVVRLEVFQFETCSTA